MAAHEPELFATLRWKRAGHRSEWEYPFAVAGVNVTFMLVGASVAGMAPGCTSTRSPALLLLEQSRTHLAHQSGAALRQHDGGDEMMRTRWQKGGPQGMQESSHGLYTPH